MLSILTNIIGLVARGRGAKAIASGLPGLVTGMFLGPEIVDALQSGFMEAGTVPIARELGMALGGLLVAAVQWAITWLAPKNAD